MSEDRISRVEQKVAVMEAVIPTIGKKIEENTASNIESNKTMVKLTVQFERIANVLEKVEDRTEDLEKRVSKNEKQLALIESSGEIKKMFLRAIIGVSVAGAGGLLIYILGSYFKATGKG